MKFLKLFEDINWEFDEEEYLLSIGVDDEVLSTSEYFEYWSEKHKKFLRIRRPLKFIIGKVEHSSNIKNDSHGDIENIPYDGYLVRGKHLDGREYLVWIKMDNLVKV